MKENKQQEEPQSSIDDLINHAIILTGYPSYILIKIDEKRQGTILSVSSNLQSQQQTESRVLTKPGYFG